MQIFNLNVNQGVIRVKSFQNVLLTVIDAKSTCFETMIFGEKLVSEGIRPP